MAAATGYPPNTYDVSHGSGAMTAGGEATTNPPSAVPAGTLDFSAYLNAMQQMHAEIERLKTAVAQSTPVASAGNVATNKSGSKLEFKVFQRVDRFDGDTKKVPRFSL